MADVGTRVSVGSKAPETGQYRHTACTNTIIVNKGETMPPCEMPKCPNRGADWRLVKKLT
jgi:hypothetical protein